MDYRSRILVVDDDISLLEQLEQELGETYQVSLALSGKQALTYLRSGQWVDLILLDVIMPEMDGFETLQEIRRMEKYSRKPIIFLTGLNTPIDEVHCLSVSSDYIAKPFSPMVLKSRIERALKFAGCLDTRKLEQLPHSLSEMELYTAILIAQGCSNAEISQMLNYTTGSTKNLVMRTLTKLSIDNRKKIDQYMMK